MNSRNGSVAATARRGDREKSGEKDASREKASDRVQSADTATQRSRTTTGARPTRRVVRPDYDRQGVSSIESIMTGIPYERNRWEYQRDAWYEEELRRRRMRRNRRYQQPF
jgi:hypothetical protein